MTDISRLFTTLQVSGLQVKDPVVYQLLRDIITNLSGVSKQVTVISGGASTTIIQTQIIPGLEGSDGIDGDIGAPGIQGAIGPSGPAGGVSSGAFGTRPAAGTSGHIFFPTDGYSIAEDNGTSWLPFGPLFAFTTPDDTTYSWVNQLTSTSGNQKDAAVLTSANASATDNLFLRVKAAPATPYTVTAALLCYIPFLDFFGYGLCFRDSVSGKIVTNEVTSNSSVNVNDLALFSGKYNSATSFNSSYTLTGSLSKAGPIGKGIVWMRIGDDGVNRTWALSMDGQNFTTIFSVARTDFITANQVGYYMHTSNASYGNIPLTLLSWK